MDFLESLDQGAVHPFRYVTQVAALRPVTVALSVLGHPLSLLLVVVVAAALLTRRGDGRSAVRLVLAFLVAMAVGFLGVALVPRPWPNTGWSPLPPLTANSFPSIHAVGAAAVYGALGVFVARRTGRRWPLVVGPLLALLAGAGQLLVAHNFLTDVLAGWMAGAVLAVLCTDLPAGEAR